MIERSLRANGVPLAAVEAGAGGRPLLLVHGFTGAKEDFTPWLDQLASMGWHAVAFDNRGHGASGQPDDPAAYSFALMTADVVAVIAELGWSSCTMLGHSMGGMVAQMVALDRPELIDALVLMDTRHAPMPPELRDIVELGNAVVRSDGIAGLMAAMAALGPGDDPGITGPDRALREADPASSAWCDSKLLASAPTMFTAMSLEMLTTPDRLARLATAVRVPTLVIVGEHDQGFRGDSKRMAETIAAAQLAVIPGGGHCPQFEAPDAWWAALSTFLAQGVP